MCQPFSHVFNDVLSIVAMLNGLPSLLFFAYNMQSIQH